MVEHFKLKQMNNIENNEFFNRMLIAILFENISWDKAMKHVLGFVNSPYFGFFKIKNNNNTTSNQKESRYVIVFTLTTS